MSNNFLSLELSSEMHCIVDKALHIVYVNPAFCSVIPTEFSQKKIERHNFLQIVVSKERDNVKQFFQNLQAGKVHYFKCEICNTLNDVVFFNAKVFLDNATQYYHIVGQIQLERENTLARFKRFFDLSLLNMMVVLDAQGKFVLANKGFLDIMGFEWQDVQQSFISDIVHQEEQEELKNFIISLKDIEGQVRTIISRCITKTKGFRWISWRFLFIKEYFYATANDITEIKLQEIEIQSLLKKTISLNQTLESQNEELTQKEEELRRMVFDLQRTLEELEQRNFELDQFVYKTSHDLRAPLTSILGLVNIAKIDNQDINRLMEYFNMIEKSTQKLEQFINSMLEYLKAGRSEAQSQKIDFYELVNSCLEDLKYIKNANRLHTTITSEGVPNFYSDYLRLKIIFNNIISNAVKYQLDRGELIKSYLQIHLDFTNPAQATITFEDNGIGIEEAYLSKVFDMFFRATEKSDGSGLGMYIVKQTVHKLNGTIQIKSRYGEGTKITLVIPNSLPQNE
ncbi:MAG: ATP-binding protein [Microscillaceae bacterium]|nr:ATP-binding protein [Microscillaceae bacterium]MDW8460578.1 ATP-binding protein [Cytophagales bacterium]